MVFPLPKFSRRFLHRRLFLRRRVVLPLPPLVHDGRCRRSIPSGRRLFGKPLLLRQPTTGEHDPAIHSTPTPCISSSGFFRPGYRPGDFFPRGLVKLLPALLTGRCFIIAIPAVVCSPRYVKQFPFLKGDAFVFYSEHPAGVELIVRPVGGK